ncbi:MAG: hypothetical protein U0103_06660 [Candidatus Obscuribacterales bacterium]|jgi:hypothetical protein|nr:hypothetical protein [Cyanobacteria bacterium SZAS LIN-5]RTL41420.1 MAG: hypothetical protein EKK48_13730 [Candidatus Melainabacteria bacterium]
MQRLEKIFDNKGVKVLAGDIDAGDYEFNMGALWGGFETVQLQGEIKSLTLQTEESVKKVAGTLGWGLAGSLVLGPVGMLAGLALGGNRKEVCALCELKDGRKFLATMDSKIYQQMLALSMMK